MSTGTNPSGSDDTLRVWQSRTRRKLSDDDCREIEKNISGFLAVLAEWTGANLSRPEPTNANDNSLAEDRPK